MWESRLYGEHACPAPQPNSSGWDLGEDGKLWNGRNGRSQKLSHSLDVIAACICSNDVNVCGSTHCRCVVNGNFAMAAFLVLLVSIIEAFHELPSKPLVLGTCI